MALIFNPSIIVAATRYELPRPITSLRIQDSWDFARFKVPLQAGDLTAGRSQSGSDIYLEGQIGTQAGMLKSGEQDMLTTLEQLRALLALGEDTELALVLYRDDVTGDEHYLLQCALTRFEYDLSDKHLFTYSAVIHASDPMIHIGLLA